MKWAKLFRLFLRSPRPRIAIDFRFPHAPDVQLYVTGQSARDLEDINDDGTVDAMTFEKITDGGGAYVESVIISMTVTSGDITETISAAAVIRRNLQ